MRSNNKETASELETKRQEFGSSEEDESRVEDSDNLVQISQRQEPVVAPLVKWERLELLLFRVHFKHGISYKTMGSVSSSDNPLNQQASGSERAAQREAALMKFRLKRKERCFEKKVRYHRRKNLAEQRPRIKGQFIRKLDDSRWGNEYSSSDDS